MTDEADDSLAPSLRGGLPPDASRLFRVYRTMSNMLEKRGYMVPRELRELTPATFVARFGQHPSRESLTILVVRAIFVGYYLLC
jgi:DNA-directed RNA polymerase I, II, and III subunit RPABC1